MKSKPPLFNWIAFAALLAVILVFVLRSIPKHDVPAPSVSNQDSLDRAAEPLVMQLQYELAAQLESEVSELRGIAIDSMDNIFLAGADTLKVIRPDGSFVREWSLSEPATCVALDDDANVYVGHATRIDVFRSTGEPLASWGKEGKSRGEFSVLSGMSISGPNIFVADAGNRCVYRFDLTGDFIDDIGKPDEERGIDGIVCPSPWLDVAVGPNGRLFVGNPGRSRVEEYRYDGSLVSYWGQAGTKIQDFFGCCNPTNLALLPENFVVTAEKLTSRVKVYDLDGTLLANIASGVSKRKETGLDLAVDSSGRILVADPASGLVSIFSQRN